MGDLDLMVQVTGLVAADSIENIENQTGYLKVLILACAIPCIYPQAYLSKSMNSCTFVTS